MPLAALDDHAVAKVNFQGSSRCTVGVWRVDRVRWLAAVDSDHFISDIRA